MGGFAKLLPELLREFTGSKQQLARAIHITPSSLSHMAAGTVSPSVAVCLRLAMECGVSASKILRAANKGDVADLIEGLYGRAASRRVDHIPYTRDEVRRIDQLRTLSPKALRALDVLIAAAAIRAIVDDDQAEQIDDRRRA